MRLNLDGVDAAGLTLLGARSQPLPTAERCRMMRLSSSLSSSSSSDEVSDEASDEVSDEVSDELEVGRRRFLLGAERCHGAARGADGRRAARARVSEGRE